MDFYGWMDKKKRLKKKYTKSLWSDYGVGKKVNDSEFSLRFYCFVSQIRGGMGFFFCRLLAYIVTFLFCHKMARQSRCTTVAGGGGSHRAAPGGGALLLIVPEESSDSVAHVFPSICPNGCRAEPVSHLRSGKLLVRENGTGRRSVTDIRNRQTRRSSRESGTRWGNYAIRITQPGFTRSSLVVWRKYVWRNEWLTARDLRHFFFFWRPSNLGVELASSLVRNEPAQVGGRTRPAHLISLSYSEFAFWLLSFDILHIFSFLTTLFKKNTRSLLDLVPIFAFPQEACHCPNVSINID